MTTYFFDFRANQAFSRDDEGMDLVSASHAHEEALKAIVDAICDVIMEGHADQRFAIEVRDHIGPVLDITAVFASTIHRKQ